MLNYFRPGQGLGILKSNAHLILCLAFNNNTLVKYYNDIWKELII